MPNSNRRRGDYFERRTRATMENEGWLVVRSAGSLGPADLVAMRRDSQPLLISCKLHRRLARLEVITLTDAAENAGALAVMASSPKPGYLQLEWVGRHGMAPYQILHMPARGLARG